MNVDEDVLKRDYSKVPAAVALQAMFEGKEVACNWERVHFISLDRWFVLNVNHFKNGQWYVKNDHSSINEEIQ